MLTDAPEALDFDPLSLRMLGKVNWTDDVATNVIVRRFSARACFCVLDSLRRSSPWARRIRFGAAGSQAPAW